MQSFKINIDHIVRAKSASRPHSMDLTLQLANRKMMMMAAVI